MLPSVGRIVHYHTRGSADGVFPPTVFAALITEVCDSEASKAAGENCVSLVTFGPSGFRFENHVKEGSEVGQWSWPPRI